MYAMCLETNLCLTFIQTQEVFVIVQNVHWLRSRSYKESKAENIMHFLPLTTLGVRAKVTTMSAEFQSNHILPLCHKTIFISFIYPYQALYRSNLCGLFPCWDTYIPNIIVRPKDSHADFLGIWLHYLENWHHTLSLTHFSLSSIALWWR